jgi:hypothetical protein
MHAATIAHGRDGGWYLNGHTERFAPRLDGVPVSSARLCTGDELALGLERYRFVMFGDDPAARAAVIAAMIDE